MESNFKSRVISGFLWRFFQQLGTQLIGLVISIILARILSPGDYGLVAMVTVFTNIANVFVRTGFTSAVVQKKELSPEDISTMFYTGMATSLVVYGVVYISAPAISSFYKEPLLVDLLRVEALIVVLGATHSIQHSLLSRELKFKTSFFIGLTSIVAQGIVGILMAVNGFGPWAIVGASLTNSAVTSILMWIFVKWKPLLVFSVASFRSMFVFSTRMLAAGLLDSVFNNIRSIIIGAQYSAEDLAYYNKGYQYPTLIMTQVDGSTTTVLFSSLSKYQNDWDKGLQVLRRAMKTSLYICAPLMAGMYAVADPMVRVLLTDKWEESIIYVRLVCIICIFWPLSAQRHALNALGKTKVSLWMNLRGKIITMICLLLTYRHSVELMIASSIFASAICLVINAFVYRKHLNYSFRHQIADIAPALLLATAMGLITYTVMFLNLPSFLTLLIQVPLGAAIYIAGSALTRNESFFYLLTTIKGYLHKRKHNDERG